MSILSVDKLERSPDTTHHHFHGLYVHVHVVFIHLILCMYKYGCGVHTNTYLLQLILIGEQSEPTMCIVFLYIYILCHTIISSVVINMLNFVPVSHTHIHHTASQQCIAFFCIVHTYLQLAYLKGTGAVRLYLQVLNLEVSLNL